MEHHSSIEGTEFATYKYGIFPDEAHTKNVPCARCMSKRSAVMMLPARRTCPDAWTREYEGQIDVVMFTIK